MPQPIGNTKNTSEFILDRVAFFGRTYNEYQQMFNFEAEHWQGKKILDCPSGPASFVAEGRKNNLHVTGCDPLYDETIHELVEKATFEIQECIKKSADFPNLFCMNTVELREQFMREKLAALKNFSEDFPRGLADGRYHKTALPKLPFADKSFDLVLSGYFLFIYSDAKYGGVLENSPFDYEFHLASILEMIRLAKEEIRIYPLKGPNQKECTFVEQIIADLAKRNIKSEINTAAYKDIGGANYLLRIHSSR